ncbi:uncharacterized protein BDV14DRAFT_86521 [Aspergillus stella-maris]|uniref:uncharacterized protein n=1 Tax=Aspergillus stella-maris TaxID=1810926 RepID=UPI003CCDA436
MRQCKTQTRETVATPGKWGMGVYDREVKRSMSNICQMKCPNPENMKRERKWIKMRSENGDRRKRTRGALAKPGVDENHDYRDFSTPRPREKPAGSRWCLDWTRSFRNEIVSNGE